MIWGIIRRRVASVNSESFLFFLVSFPFFFLDFYVYVVVNYKHIKVDAVSDHGSLGLQDSRRQELGLPQSGQDVMHKMRY